MKQFLYRIFCVIALFILIPIVFTFLIQGNGEHSIEDLQFVPKTETAESVLFQEDILPGILANEISMETETEAIKAQAVIARTNCLRALEQGEDLPEGLTKGEMIRIWGQENFSEYYSQLENAVEATKGIAMVYRESENGAIEEVSPQNPAEDSVSPEQPEASSETIGYIRADFHKCSAGYTRDAAEKYEKKTYTYLKSADSRMDLSAVDFLIVVFYTKEQFVEKGGELFSEETRTTVSEKTAEELLSQISVTKQDSAGYITEIEIDKTVHSGEEVRLLYGWNSSAFSLKEVDGEIRVVTKGLGHGLGVSLYSANELAKSGYSYKDILKYFYTGIEFVTQYD